MDQIQMGTSFLLREVSQALEENGVCAGCCRAADLTLSTLLKVFGWACSSDTDCTCTKPFVCKLYLHLYVKI
jgi:hypothetical protein